MQELSCLIGDSEPFLWPRMVRLLPQEVLERVAACLSLSVSSVSEALFQLRSLPGSSQLWAQASVALRPAAAP